MLSSNWITDWRDFYAKQAYERALEPFYRGKTCIELKNIKEVHEYFVRSSYVSLIAGIFELSVTAWLIYEFKKLFLLHKKVKEKLKTNQETTWQEDRYFEDMIKTALIIPFGILGSCALLTQAAIETKVQQFAFEALEKANK